MIMNKKKLSLALWATALLAMTVTPADACTGITLKSKDGQTVVARTIEWGGSDLNSQYVIVPRGYKQQSFLPGGATDGMTFTARHGYVGLSVEQEQFVAEGLNEAGLSAGLFYFPAYGQYESYDPAEKATTLADLQLAAYILGECATIEEVKEAVKRVHVVQIDPRASTVHWRFTDPTGRQVVLEIVEGGQLRFYENPLGVLDQLARPALAPDQPEQLRQPVPRPGTRPPTGQHGAEAIRARAAVSWAAGRRDPSLTLRTGRFLPGHSPATGHSEGSRLAGVPDPEQLRHTRGH